MMSVRNCKRFIKSYALLVLSLSVMASVCGYGQNIKTKISKNNALFDSIRKENYKNFLTADPSISLEKSRYALSLAMTQKQKVIANRMVAISYMLKTDFDSSRVYYMKAINMSRDMADPIEFIASVNSYSNLDKSNMDDEELVKLLYEALDKASEHNLESRKNRIFQSLADSHISISQLDKAEDILNTLLNKDISPSSLGGVYRSLEEIHYQRKDYQTALEFAFKSLNHTDPKSINYAVSLTLVGRDLLKLNRLKESERYFNLSLNHPQTNSFPKIVNLAYLSLVELYKITGNQKKEIELLNLCESNFIKFKDHYHLKTVYQGKANYFSRLRQFDKEEFYNTKYQSLIDSIDFEEKNKLRLTLDSKYQLSQKKKELEFKDKIIAKETALK